MHTVIDFDAPTAVIMHFAEDEEVALASGRRLIHYQVMIDPNNRALWSPDNEFMRFEHGKFSEVHGWVKVASVVIDTVLRVIDDAELAEVA